MGSCHAHWHSGSAAAFLPFSTPSEPIKHLIRHDRRSRPSLALVVHCGEVYTVTEVAWHSSRNAPICSSTGMLDARSPSPVQPARGLLRGAVRGMSEIDDGTQFIGCQCSAMDRQLVHRASMEVSTAAE